MEGLASDLMDTSDIVLILKLSQGFFRIYTGLWSLASPFPFDKRKPQGILLFNRWERLVIHFPALFNLSTFTSQGHKQQVQFSNDFNLPTLSKLWKQEHTSISAFIPCFLKRNKLERDEMVRLLEQKPSFSLLGKISDNTLFQKYMTWSERAHMGISLSWLTY